MANARDAMRFVQAFNDPHGREHTTPSHGVLLDLCQTAINADRRSDAIAYLDAVRYSLERCKLTHIHSDTV